MDDINLNDKENLNPVIGNVKLNEAQREKVLEHWNNQPEVRENGFEAFDKERKKLIGKSQLGFLKLMAFLGIVSLLTVGGVLGYSFYNNYNKYGELALFPKQVCAPNITVQAPIIPKCPEINITLPSCPSLTCGDTQINVVNGTVE